MFWVSKSLILFCAKNTWLKLGMNNLSILFFNMKKEFASGYLVISIILDRHIYSTDTFDKIISNTDNTELLGYLLLDSLFG